MSENYISCKAENGSINISEEVISAMVRTAVTEVEELPESPTRRPVR